MFNPDERGCLPARFRHASVAPRYRNHETRRRPVRLHIPVGVMVELQNQRRTSGVGHIIGNPLDSSDRARRRPQALRRKRGRQRAAIEVQRLHPDAQLASAPVGKVRHVADRHVEIDVHRRARAILLRGHTREEAVRNGLRIARRRQLARQRHEHAPRQRRPHAQGLNASAHAINGVRPHPLLVLHRHTHTPSPAPPGACVSPCRSPAMHLPAGSMSR